MDVPAEATERECGDCHGGGITIQKIEYEGCRFNGDDTGLAGLCGALPALMRFMTKPPRGGCPAVRAGNDPQIAGVSGPQPKYGLLLAEKGFLGVFPRFGDFFTRFSPDLANFPVFTLGCVDVGTAGTDFLYPLPLGVFKHMKQ